MFYIGMNVSMLALPVQAFYRQKFGGPPLTTGLIALSFLAIFVINAVFITIPVAAGLRKLKNLEA